ncbi:MAG: hypothetical protein EBT55_02920 [Proteobacteria bacterium]|nr:hypothetical protein [Pseudomonadota bacterium]
MSNQKVEQQKNVTNQKVERQKNFINDDYGNLTTFANNLVNLIEVEAAVNEGSGVISLDAKFGMGKTHFLQMFETHLKNQEFECFFIDAWRNDFYHSSLLTILLEFANYLDEKGKKDESAKILKIAFSTLATISGQLLNKVTGIDGKEIVVEATKTTETVVDEVLQDYREQKESLQNTKDFLETYIEKLAKKPLVILVDELDRARPSYAVEFLESLKHFFDVKNIVFVLAVNREQIEKSVKCLYGELDFNEYYRKFATSNISLPYFLGDSQEYITKKFTEISSKLENKFPLDFSSLNYFVLVFKLSPRQINEFFKIFLYMRNNSGEMMLAICLYIKDPKETKRIAEGEHFGDDVKQLFAKHISVEVEEIMSQHKEKPNVMQKYAKDILNAQKMISFS